MSVSGEKMTASANISAGTLRHLIKSAIFMTENTSFEMTEPQEYLLVTTSVTSFSSSLSTVGGSVCGSEVVVAFGFLVGLGAFGFFVGLGGLGFLVGFGGFGFFVGFGAFCFFALASFSAAFLVLALRDRQRDREQKRGKQMDTEPILKTR